MSQIIKASEALANAQKDYEKSFVDAAKKIPNCKNITEAEFQELLKLECNRIIVMRRLSGEFTYDNDNQYIVSLLYKYLTADTEFKGSLDKGILLMGAIGVGKTVLIRGYARVIGRLTGKDFKYSSAFDLNKCVMDEGTNGLSKVPLVIDDLGKEPEIVNNYGTRMRPILELFAARYDEGSLTFATTNFKINTLAEKYGEQTIDRFREMFNFIELTGKSRR